MGEALRATEILDEGSDFINLGGDGGLKSSGRGWTERNDQQGSLLRAHRRDSEGFQVFSLLSH